MIRCPLCPGDHSCVAGDGPLDAEVVCLGEGPGLDEDKKGIPFIGKTGREVNEHYLPIAGLRRPNVYVDNVMKCMPKGEHGKMDLKKEPHRELLKSCAETHLYPMLRRNHYTRKLIVAMGAFACYALDPEIDLQLQHGFPVETKWGTVFVMYHPAGGIHEPKKMMHIRNDWVRLRQYLDGKLYLPEDKYDGIEDYRVVESERHLDSSLNGCHHLPLANDTETTRRGDPFCLTYSTVPGTGYLIPAEREDLLGRFQWHLDKWSGPTLWHNWLFDSRVVKSLGLLYPRLLVRDTMALVFHLGNLPQGLKDLAYRELGMTMKDFDDLVTPYAIPRVLRYYWDAYALKWPKPDPEEYRDKNGELKTKNPQSMSTKLKRFFTDYKKNPEKDIFEMWTKNWEDSHDMIEAELGPWPGKCITQAWADNPAEVIRYACRDADALLRLWPVIRKMKSLVRRRPQEKWRGIAPEYGEVV